MREPEGFRDFVAARYPGHGHLPAAFDGTGGLVEVDGRAQHDLLQGHSLPPVRD